MENKYDIIVKKHTDYFMIAFMGLMFIVMIRLLIWAMREHKRERMKYGNQSQSHK